MRAALAAFALLLACSSPEAPAPEPSPTPAATPAPAGPPVRLQANTELAPGVAEAARATLGQVVDREAADPENAWALAHGILARGPEFQATDGRLARAVLVADFLEGGAGDPRFPRTRGAVRVEPHRDLILKSLLEAGLPLGEPIAPGGPTLRALLDASERRFEPASTERSVSVFASDNDAPWSVQAWCQGAAAGGATSWKTAAGQDVQLEQVSRALLGVLEAENHAVRTAQVAGAPVQKNKKGIFAFTCGGAHLFQGAEACAAAGWPRGGNTPARLSALADLYLYRLPFETAMVDAALQQYPQLAVLLINQDVKFLGHLLESLGKAQRDGLWTPTAAERASLDAAERRLLNDVDQLARLGAYSAESMAALAGEESTFQMYLDLVGDACHALVGLRIQAGLR